MANNIHMILDANGTPLDISDYIMQQTAIVETPIYVNGQAGGTSKMGTPIYDRLRTLYQFTVPLKPGPRAIYEAIENKVKENAFDVTYTSYRAAADVTLYGQCVLNAAQYVDTINYDGSPQRIYAGPSITFEGFERT